MDDPKPNAARPNALDRRQFLRAGALLSLGSLMLTDRLFGAPRAAQGGCDPTTDDILGPYYLPGSPVTTLVADAQEPGDRLFVSGTVLANDCQSPISGVQIEVWQANAAAQYDISPNMELHATMFSDANGQYAFETIMPGAYLNGNQYRPKHIHFRVNKPGYPELITQLYFQGDPYIAADPWASQPSAAQRIIPLNPLGGGQQEGVFDIVLDGMVSVKPNPYGTDGHLMPVHPNPMEDLCSIHFNVFRPGHVGVRVCDLNGRELITLINEELQQGRYTTQWNARAVSGQRVAPGTYLYQLHMDGRPIMTQRVVVL